MSAIRYGPTTIVFHHAGKATTMGSLSQFEPILRENEPLAPHTWFKVGGPAQYFATPRGADELGELVKRCREEEIPIRLLGGGSNILVRDEGVEGVVVHLPEEHFGTIETNDNLVRAGGAARLGQVISNSVGQGLAGLEPLVGIPGTIGGALHGNTGGRGGDIGQWTHRVTVMTRSGEICERQRSDLEFAYRQSSLDELVILSAEFQLDPDDPTELARRMQKQWIVKKSIQPLGHQHTGCIFKSPRGINAGMLIDQAGLKGYRVGSAEVCDRHANYIIADEGSAPRDVEQLIHDVREKVSQRLGVELELQVNIW